MVCITEHGWNDPPTFSFSSLQSGSSKKPQMTKRVNHVTSSPDQSSSTVATQKKDTSIPPPLNTTAPPPMVFNVKEDAKTKTQDNENPERTRELTTGNDEESESRTFDQVLATLTELTEKHCETAQVVVSTVHCKYISKCILLLQKRTLDEIKRRLEILSKQWEEGKLSQPVQAEMTKLTVGTFYTIL